MPMWMGGSSTREDNTVFNGGRRRADVVHTPIPGNPNGDIPSVIELKCQSWMQDAIDLDNLAKEINKDIAKIALANRNGALNPRPRWYAIGIGIDAFQIGGAVDHAKHFNFVQATNWTQASPVNQFSATIFWCTY